MIRFLTMMLIAAGLAIAADPTPAPDKFVDPFSSQKLSTLGAQMQTLQVQAENVQLKQQLLQFQAKEVMAEAFKAAGLNSTDWDLDLSSGKFTKKTPPPDTNKK